MPPFDKSKRSIVKHRTNKPFTRPAAAGSSSGDSAGKKDGRRGGFKVGPSHAPDGAYLGKAKKIKANLIANAKTKKKFYKSIDTKGKGKAVEPAAGDDEAEGSGGLGRFAPADGKRSRDEDDEATEQHRQRRRSRAGPAPGEDDGKEEEKRGHPQGYSQGKQQRMRRAAALAAAAEGKAPGGKSAATTAEPPSVSKKPKFASREEALEARRKRQEAWDKVKTRPGEQPNLGGQMQVLLQKIQQG